MTLAWLVVLILGLVALYKGFKAMEYNNSTFWFLTAFWAYIVLSPWAVLARPML